jgi:sulfoxide reductase heme-binding subunit YedZ
MTTWLIIRAAGIGAFAMTFLSVVWGLAATTGVLGRRVSRATATTLHQFLATTGLVLLGVHLGALLLDTFTPFSPADVLVPLHSSYRPVAVAFGVVAMYAVVVVIVLSWMRKTIGATWWRRSHLLAVPTFALALAHGIFSGADTTRPWMWWSYVASAAIVVFLLVVRALTSGVRPVRPAARTTSSSRPERRTAAATGRSATAPTRERQPV